MCTIKKGNIRFLFVMKRLLLLTIPVLLGGLPHQGQAQTGLAISELLYQPKSGEAEYVELYNNSSSDVDLSGFHIVRVLHDTLATHYPLPQFTLGAHQYAVLTGDGASVMANYRVEHPARLIECHLPPYPNSGGSVVLCTADGVVVERFDYSPSMHSRLLRDKAGVSLERRSFERGADEVSNWYSASSTSGYGTPTAPNSQSSEWLVEENSFSFSSPTLSPDGDNYQDELEIDYRLEASDLAARAEVYDSRGQMVRRLLNGEILGTAGTLRWDGKDQAGGLLPMGQYLVMITLYNTAGTRQTLRRTVAVVR